MDPIAANAYLPLVANLLEGKDDQFDHAHDRQMSTLRFATPTAAKYQISEYGIDNSPEKAPENSVAILNVTDVITKYDQDCGPSGAITKSDLLTRADQNKNIKSVLINMDTPGGEGYAGMRLAETIEKMEKPVVAFVDDMCASAGYMIASACDYVVANNPLAMIGSIGTYVTLADYQDYFKQKGIRLLDVYADKSTDKNKIYRDALAGDTKELKQQVNQFNDLFLSSIIRRRGAKVRETEADWSTGKLFFADKALSIGLIDQVASFEDTLQSLTNS
jgi:signal peptide peptidase SppA